MRGAGVGVAGSVGIWLQHKTRQNEKRHRPANREGNETELVPQTRDPAVLPERVADGNTHASGVVRAVVDVIVDQVEARFRADEEAAVGIEFNAAAEIGIEVVAGRDQAATATPAARTDIAGIEVSVESTDAAHEFNCNVGGDFGGIHGVEIVKNWTKIESISELRGQVVVALGSSPEHLRSDAEVMPEGDIAADTGIGAAGKRLGNVVRAVVSIAGTGSIDRADAEGDVNFLSLGGIGKRGQKGTCEGQNKDNLN